MTDSILFVALAALAAAWVTTHVATLVGVARSRLSIWLRVLAVLPPVTPVAAVMAGAYWRAALWVLSAVGYVVIRWGVG